MVVSFKISKVGSRFKPKPLVSEAAAATNDIEVPSPGSSKIHSKNEVNNSTTPVSASKLDGRDADAAGFSGSLSSIRHLASVGVRKENYGSLAEVEVSFVLNLYPDGYSIGKPSEGNGYHSALQDVSKSLHPYDKASETLFSAIECGRLPGDILDDIPCKYVDGGLVCELRDFRKCIPDAGSNVQSIDLPPVITKLHLKMSLENVVRDISLIADDSWSYGDLMEVESRILKSLQPSLCLDPTPRLDRLCESPLSSKINLGLSGLRKRRLRQIPEVTVTTNSGLHGKKICVGRLPDSMSYRLGESGPGDVISQNAQETLPGQNIGPSNMLASRGKNFAQEAAMSAMNVMPHPSKFQAGTGSQRLMQETLASPVLNAASVPSTAGQDMTFSYSDNANSNSFPHVKMDSQGPVSPYTNKRTKVAGSSASDSIQQQPVGSYVDGLQVPDVQWRNQVLMQQQANLRGVQYSNNNLQKYPQLIHDGTLNQDALTTPPMSHQSMRYGGSGDHIENEKLDKVETFRVKNDPHVVEGEHSQMDPRLQHRPSPQAMRPGFQPGWSSLNQQLGKDSRKEESNQKRKSTQSPRVSAGKSADLPSGSFGNQYGPVSSTVQLGSSQREKSGTMLMPPHAVRSQSVTSGGNDLMQQQHQAQLAAQWRSSSLPKNPAMGGVGSPASVGNISIPMNAASPSVGTPSSADQILLERFAKLEMVVTRHKLNGKRTKADEMSQKLPKFLARDVMNALSNGANNDNIKEENCSMPLSKSIVSGSMNTPKIRVLTFMFDPRAMQGNATCTPPPKMTTRLIMSEKQQDGTVAMYFGDIEDQDYLSNEDYLLTIPSTHSADLLASQLCSLMIRDGYFVEDHVQPRPPARPNILPKSQLNVPGAPSEVQQYGETALASGQPAHETKPVVDTNPALSSPSNILPSTAGMLSPGNPRGLQSSQGIIAGVSYPMRPQQIGDPHQPHSQQPMQLPNQQTLIQQSAQFQRSLLMPPNSLSQLNPLSQNSNLPISNPMVNNKPSPLQMLQNQSPTQPQMQQAQMQRKMMMGLGPSMGMGNLANNMVGLSGLGNMMGIGGVGPRGMGVSGMSSPVGPIPGIGNMPQNPMGLSASSSLSAISQHLRSGALTQTQAQLLAARTRMGQSRGMLGGPHQPGVAGLSGARNLPPGSPGLSMLGQALNRGSNMNPMQRTAMGAMAAPKLMTGMNVHMNSQQLQQQMQQQQPQQQHQQPQQPQQPQQMQQQEASPLQAVVSPQQASSPSTIGVPQPPANQTMAQSPQLSSGAIQNPPSSSNVEAVGPTSPQLSSQTLGSVGSITNSPMDLQGVNKNSNA